MGTTVRLRRPAAVVVWLAGIVGTHAVLPVVVAHRPGRTVSPPRPARLAGVGCVLAGSAGLAWSLAQHFENAPEEGYEAFTFAPEYLLRTGPYGFSRNPMYVSEVVVWAGWSLLFADRLLAGLTCLLALGLNRAAGVEEAALAARFGETWHEYAKHTPRWIGAMSE
jgi:protein-S-isoprenylcysteine O-methyltransferase Ste14